MNLATIVRLSTGTDLGSTSTDLVTSWTTFGEQPWHEFTADRPANRTTKDIQSAIGSRISSEAFAAAEDPGSSHMQEGGR